VLLELFLGSPGKATYEGGRSNGLGQLGADAIEQRPLTLACQGRSSP